MTGCRSRSRSRTSRTRRTSTRTGELSRSEERTLYEHYGLGYDDSLSGSGTGAGAGNGDGDYDRDRGDAEGTVGRDTSGPTTDDAMTRSEEELTSAPPERETGKARLRKYVVTEDVEKTVPVRREEVRVEREPITDANVDDATEGPAISEEEHEVTLHAEEAVVEKRAVPKERVRLDKDDRRGGAARSPRPSRRSRSRSTAPRSAASDRPRRGRRAAGPCSGRFPTSGRRHRAGFG